MRGERKLGVGVDLLLSSATGRSAGSGLGFRLLVAGSTSGTASSRGLFSFRIGTEISLGGVLHDTCIVDTFHNLQICFNWWLINGWTMQK